MVENDSRPSLREIFAGKLRITRLYRGLGPSEFARRSGVARSYIYDLEQGRSSPTLRMVKRLAESLEVSSSELLSPPVEIPPDTPEGLLEAARRRKLLPNEFLWMAIRSFNGRSPDTVEEWLEIYDLLDLNLTHLEMVRRRRL